ncbi:uncharacterized [Tachysurus ichikawai]
MGKSRGCGLTEKCCISSNISENIPGSDLTWRTQFLLVVFPNLNFQHKVKNSIERQDELSNLIDFAFAGSLLIGRRDGVKRCGRPHRAQIDILHRNGSPVQFMQQGCSITALTHAVITEQQAPGQAPE